MCIVHPDRIEFTMVSIGAQAVMMADVSGIEKVWAAIFLKGADSIGVLVPKKK